jgi:hypothetical protein
MVKPWQLGKSGAILLDLGDRCVNGIRKGRIQTVRFAGAKRDDPRNEFCWANPGPGVMMSAACESTAAGTVVHPAR